MTIGILGKFCIGIGTENVLGFFLRSKNIFEGELRFFGGYSFDAEFHDLSIYEVFRALRALYPGFLVLLLLFSGFAPEPLILYDPPKDML